MGELGPESTIIDGDSSGSVIVFDSTIIQNIIRDNRADVGGEICCMDSRSRIAENIIFGNSAYG